MNENAVLYALSTLAQTCAALAAFVGAVGLFRLQALRSGRRSAEVALRVALVDVYENHDVAMYVLSTDEVVKQAEGALKDKSRASGQRAKRIENCLTAWRTFGPRLRDSRKVFVLFESWNLLVILVSLGSFAHVAALVCRSWTTPVVWIIAIVTAVISGVSVFVWLERE